MLVESLKMCEVSLYENRKVPQSRYCFLLQVDGMLVSSMTLEPRIFSSIRDSACFLLVSVSQFHPNDLHNTNEQQGKGTTGTGA